MLDTAVSAARAGGRVLQELFGRPHEVSSKGLRDLVTEADLLAQEAILREIRARYPEHQILSEEAERVLGSDARHRWFVDPLDGTTNYARGIPHFSVSVALERDGEMQAGVVYDPLGERLFHASAGGGAYLNGVRLQVSDRTRLLDALLDLGWGRSQEARQASGRAALALGPYVGSVRTMGSAALGLAAVAAGWEDLYYHPQLQPWDMAAGVLLVREAGGMATTPDGSPWDPFVGGCLASNGVLHEETLRRFRGVSGGEGSKRN